MSIPGSAEPLLLAQQDTGGYQIQRSLRFNSSDSAFLSRVPSSTGNRTTWTWAAWVKRSYLSSSSDAVPLFTSYVDTSNYSVIDFRFDAIRVINGSSGNGEQGIYTAPIYRDPSAWYHIVASSTPSSVPKLYVNGVEVTAFTGSSAVTANWTFNSTNEVWIGKEQYSSTINYFSGYLADVHFIDGQALTPSSFTEVSATTGQLVPKAYSGPTPTGNSFWLPFSDNSAATATTLGKDNFNLGNNWTPNNLSIGSNGGPGGTITSVRVRDGAGADAGFSTIRVDGVVLVQGAGTPDYRSFVSATGPYIYGTSVANTFTSNLGEAYVGGGASITFAPSPGIAYSQSVEIWTGGDANNVVSFNNGAEVATGAYSWTLIAGSLPSQTDSLVDTPTSYGTDTGAGGEVRGNYATLNLLNAAHTYSNGNLDFTISTTAYSLIPPAVSSIGVSSGKWYFEFSPVSITADPFVGITSIPATDRYPGYSAESYGYYSINGSKYNAGVGSSYGDAWTVNDVIGVAFDLDSGKIWFSKNGTWQASGSPSAGSNAAYTGIPSGVWFAASHKATNGTGTYAGSFNFGQRPFAYTAPSGFKALCDTNLPAPVVAKSSDYFQTVLYTGNGSTQTISGLNFSPDLVWGKGRSYAGSNALYDSVRGATKYLTSNGTGAEGTVQGVTAFNSDGFTLGNDSETNFNAGSLVAWCWDAGTSTVTNTQGSITTSVRASASSGFAVITGSTPSSNVNFSFGHNLGIAPSLVIYKHTAVGGNWQVYHRNGGGNNYNLNSTAGPANSGLWSGLDPTSTLITIPSTIISANSSAFVCYAWAPVTGYSSAFTYTGNGSSDGPMVWLGFRPRLILAKQSSASGTNWYLIDSARGAYNVVDKLLNPNTSDSEETYSQVDFLSNGFKIRNTGTGMNANGATMIGFAWAESPFAYSRAR